MSAVVDPAVLQGALEARRILVGGRVQGVGFRPHVYGLAGRHHLSGWVRNVPDGVEVHVQGETPALAAFLHEMCVTAPSLARPLVKSNASVPLEMDRGFCILPSSREGQAAIPVPPDLSVCDDCLHELEDPADRRHRHAFINCTRCGPRYTLITGLPYDRESTAMAPFPPCEDCRREYADPLNRRFHAEALCCPKCGPQLEFSRGTVRERENALALAVDMLRAGGVVAVKGVGGYHLMCDATSDAAIARLRERKPRPHKPLAILAPMSGDDGLDGVRAFATPDAVECEVLRSPMRPIVLLAKRANGKLSRLVAPGLAELGVMLPYSPLHHLLTTDFGGPLVATSGNLRGDPVLTETAEAEQRLSHVADGFLNHDREILRPADDAVVRAMSGRARPLRLGRGMAPLELELPLELKEPLLATGAHLKNTIAIAWGRRVVISPHVGDLDTPRSLAVFERVIGDFSRMYSVAPKRVLHDAHPGYGGSRHARQCGLPATAVYHHRAHASALAGEHPEVRSWLVFAWDGTGLGEDGTLWGSEALLGRPGHWRRISGFMPFLLPGGESAIRHPWRTALALCWEAGMEWPGCPEDTALLRQAWTQEVNTPSTSGAGRLFDGAAALIGINHHSSFEGQAPMMLESIALPGAPAVHMALNEDENGTARVDWTPLLPMLMDASLDCVERASIFHAASLAQSILDQAVVARAAHGELVVGLAGGVFQNRLLAEMAVAGLAKAGFDVRLHLQLPANDAAISYGQIIEFANQ